MLHWCLSACHAWTSFSLCCKIKPLCDDSCDESHSHMCRISNLDQHRPSCESSYGLTPLRASFFSRGNENNFPHKSENPAKLGNFGDDSPALEILRGHFVIRQPESASNMDHFFPCWEQGLSESAGLALSHFTNVLLSQMQAHPVTATKWSHWAKSGDSKRTCWTSRPQYY